jgi:hypothetical protein
VGKITHLYYVIKMITNKQKTKVMKDLVRKFPKLENELFKAYDILSAAGFEILIEDGMMQAWPKRLHIENDMEEGFVIIDDDYRDEFEERQEELEKENC